MRTLLVVLAAIVLMACEDGPATDEATSAAALAATGASPAAEAGMCAEHGVLEAICTRCNPKLIAVFKAKGDWCEEHEYPESVCPTCHPERGGKPETDVGSTSEDGAPADGTKVRFKSPEVAAKAGIATVDAIVSPSAAAITAPAKVVYDATKLAHVNARAPGVVTKLLVDVGSEVKRGQTLAVIESGEVSADRSLSVGAAARVQAAKETLERQEDLFEEGLTARKSVVEAEKELAQAKAEHAALLAPLSVVGKHAGGAGGYALEAPIDGVVTVRRPTMGELVEANQLVYEVVDTSSVWIEIEVAESDLASVRPKSAVALAIDSLPKREFQGTIDFVAPAIDPRTRTAMARMSLDNPGGLLRANMFGRARILAEDERPAVLVPRDAVQRAREVRLVFVELTTGEYEARRVRLGTSGDERTVEIAEGIRAGEPVVTTGSFLLKTETLKESIGAGCCEVE